MNVSRNLGVSVHLCNSRTSASSVYSDVTDDERRATPFPRIGHAFPATREFYWKKYRFTDTNNIKCTDSNTIFLCLKI